MEREIAKLRARLKKTPLQEFTERVHNDDCGPEVEEFELAAQIAEQIRRELPDMPRFTIRKLKIDEDTGELKVEVTFDLPCDAKRLQGRPISISSKGTLNSDGTVDLG
jgi:hypothetical protein